MTAKFFEPSFKIYLSPDEVGFYAAEKIAALLAIKPNAVIALPTGDTALPMYRHLVRMHQERKIDFSKAVFFNLDEYIGLPPEDERSYHYYMYENFFKHIGISPAQINVPDGMTDNVDTECRRYEAKIEVLGGFDLVVAGTGQNGHLGFCERIVARATRTHKAALMLVTRVANSRLFNNDLSQVPTHAISLGLTTMVEAKEVLLLAAGPTKAPPLLGFMKCWVRKKLDSDLAISILLKNPAVTFCLDVQAASLIPLKWLNPDSFIPPQPNESKEQHQKPHLAYG